MNSLEKKLLNDSLFNIAGAVGRAKDKLTKAQQEPFEKIMASVYSLAKAIREIKE